MLGCEWAVVLPVLPTATRKQAPPLQNPNHLDDSGKHREKKKKHVYVIYLYANVLYYNSNN